MQQLIEDVPRLLSAVDLPDYTYTTGQGLPHPYRDPRGHSHGKKNRTPKALIASQWAENATYLLALDYFNYGFYWEAHDTWERLSRVTGPDTLPGRFLKGLVKMGAAGLKVREQSVHGVRRHAASAGEVFADVAAECGEDYYCGLELTMLQFAADRSAQLSYKRDLPVGEPLRVFPFTLTPEPLPLG